MALPIIKTYEILFFGYLVSITGINEKKKKKKEVGFLKNKMPMGAGEQFHSIRLPPNTLEIIFLNRFLHKWVISVIGKWLGNVNHNHVGTVKYRCRCMWTVST